MFRMPPCGKQSSGLFLSAEVLRGMYFVPVCHIVAHHIVALTYEHLSQSDQLWSIIILTTDQLSQSLISSP